MDFDFYRNFIVTAETGNISAAAKRLSIVQPALSAQIKTLEKYYGATLFKTGRGKRRIELTEAGKSFLKLAKALCQSEDNLNLAMQAFRNQEDGVLRFAVSHVRTDYFIRRFIVPFAKKYPRIRYQFYDETVETQIDKLTEGLIDFAFANAPLPPQHDFASIGGPREYFYAFYSPLFPSLKQNESLVTPDAFKALPLATNYGSYALIRNVFKEYGFKPNIAFIGTAATDAISFATGGLAVAIAAALPEDPVPPGVTRAKIAEGRLSFPQTLYWHSRSTMSLAAELFLGFFKEEAKKAQC